MGVNNYIEFGGVKSSDYGIYVSGEGVFKSAERVVDFLEIPGRNGEYAFDKGTFKNIKVSYRVFNQEDDLEDFRTKLSDFRNALLSKTGYQRLEDTFHPDEYRMAVYAGPMDIEPILYNTASEFELTFDCKPQRFLKSGEVKQTVTSGQELTNPTLFESHPLLEFVGLGDININDDVITVHDSAMGKVLLANKTARGDNPYTLTESRFNSGNYSLLENGDLIRVEDGSTMYAGMDRPRNSVPFDSFSASVTGGTIGATVVVTDESIGAYNVVLEPFYYTKGTFLVNTVEVSVSFSITIDGAVISWDGVITYQYEYDPSGTPRVYYGLSISPDLPSGFTNAITLPSYLATIYGYSTRTGGGVQYIDLDIGEAYIMTDGVPVSINNIVSIPARLPELKSGDNHITHDDTITSLKVTPRWWKI